MSTKTVWIIAQKELRDALRNRWFVLYGAAFAALSLAFSAMSLAGASVVGFAGFGRTAASLINLVLLLVPLMSLTVGAQSLSVERERGTLAYLLAQPVARAEVFLGKLVGLFLGVTAAISLGFGLSGVVLAAGGGGASVEAYAALVLLAVIVAAAMLSLGMLVSALSRQAGVAVGVGLLLWFGFVFVGDLGMMGTAIVLRLPVDGLFALSLANPLQVFKMAAVLAINATLDVMGPAGIYATQRYGPELMVVFVAVLIAWAIVPAALAYWRFAALGDV